MATGKTHPTDRDLLESISKTVQAISNELFEGKIREQEILKAIRVLSEQPKK